MKNRHAQFVQHFENVEVAFILIETKHHAYSMHKQIDIH